MGALFWTEDCTWTYGTDNPRALGTLAPVSKMLKYKVWLWRLTSVSAKTSILTYLIMPALRLLLVKRMVATWLRFAKDQGIMWTSPSLARLGWMVCPIHPVCRTAQVSSLALHDCSKVVSNGGCVKCTKRCNNIKMCWLSLCWLMTLWHGPCPRFY